MVLRVVCGVKGAEGATAAQEPRPLEEVIGDYIRSAVDGADGNVREAARRLKVSPSTIYARLKQATKQ